MPYKLIVILVYGACFFANLYSGSLRYVSEDLSCAFFAVHINHTPAGRERCGRHNVLAVDELLQLRNIGCILIV